MCPVCHNEESIFDSSLNIVLPGLLCQQKRSVNELPHPTEFIGETIKKERQEFAKSIIQPFNRYGQFSEEYYQAYGTKGVSVTPRQVKERKRIWDGDFSRNIDITKTK